MIKNSMFTVLAALKNVVLKYISEDSWGWDGNRQLMSVGIHPLCNLTDDEATSFATASCPPTLWAFRALAYRLGVSVPQADWFWYNEPREQFRRFVTMALETRALVGAPSGHNFGRTLGFLATGLKVEYEFSRKGDTLARAYWSDGVNGGCISVYSPTKCTFLCSQEEEENYALNTTECDPLCFKDRPMCAHRTV